MEAIVEAAGPECIVPGQVTPIKLLGVKVASYSFSFFSSLKYMQTYLVHSAFNKFLSSQILTNGFMG